MWYEPRVAATAAVAPSSDRTAAGGVTATAVVRRRHGKKTERPAVLQQAEKDVDATVQGLLTAVHSVPVQQYRHHLSGGGLHDCRCVHIHCHRGRTRQCDRRHRPGGREPQRHGRPDMGHGVLQRVLRRRVEARSSGAPPVLPEPRHRGGPQLQLRGPQQADDPLVVFRIVPLLAVRHHHHR